MVPERDIAHMKLCAEAVLLHFFQTGMTLCSNNRTGKHKNFVGCEVLEMCSSNYRIEITDIFSRRRFYV